jgi:hypothetical protein
VIRHSAEWVRGPQSALFDALTYADYSLKSLWTVSSVYECVRFTRPKTGFSEIWSRISCTVSFSKLPSSHLGGVEVTENPFSGHFVMRAGPQPCDYCRIAD